MVERYYKIMDPATALQYDRVHTSHGFDKKQFFRLELRSGLKSDHFEKEISTGIYNRLLRTQNKSSPPAVFVHPVSLQLAQVEHRILSVVIGLQHKMIRDGRTGRSILKPLPQTIVLLCLTHF